MTQRHLSRKDIELLIPHRMEALPIDSAIYTPEAKEYQLIAAKELFGSDLYFRGHYPGELIFPGHWQVESICVVAALLCRLMFPAAQGFPILTSLEGVSFKRPIKPGDKIEIKARFIKHTTGRNNLQIFLLSGAIFRKNKLISSIREIGGTCVTL